MALTQGLFSAMVADATPADLRGTGFGVYNLLGGLALLVASVVAGALWSAFGPASTFLTGAGISILVLTCLVVLNHPSIGHQPR